MRTQKNNKTTYAHTAVKAAIGTMVAFLLFALAFFLINSHTPDTAQPGTQAAPARAIYIYMCGSTLESNSGAATKNIREILEADIPEDTQVIIQTGGSAGWRDYDIPADKLARYKVENNRLVLIETQPDSSMGAPDTLKDFLSFCVGEYPAEKAGLILWNHGNGTLGGVCYDANHDFDALSYTEMETGLSVLNDYNTRLDFVGFDACLMATIDSVQLMCMFADNLIASQEVEPSGGWDYGALVSAYGQEDFYTQVLAAYQEKCRENGNTIYTLSHIDLTQYQQILGCFGSLVDTMDTIAEDSMESLMRMGSSALSFGSNSPFTGYTNLIDIGDMAHHCGREDIAEDLGSYVETVRGEDRQGATGISMFFPCFNLEHIEDYMSSLFFIRYFHFLNKNFVLRYQENMITFGDKGHLEDGELFAEIDEETAENVKEVLYTLKKKGEAGEDIYLGRDLADWTQGNTYKTDFHGEWFSMGGYMLHGEIAGRHEDSYTYQTPVMRNGIAGALFFTYDSATQQCTVQGFGERTPNNENSRLEQLLPGDTITLLSVDTLSQREDYTSQVIGEFTYTADSNVEVSRVEPGTYILQIVVVDIFGNTYLSDEVTVEY